LNTTTGGWTTVEKALRVGSEVVDGHPMTYIVQRQDRFYAVAYDVTGPP